MPAGKPGILGGYGGGGPLTHAVSIRSLRRRRKRNNTPPPLSKEELREQRRLLRKWFRIYLIEHSGSQPTATDRRLALEMIKTAARRLIASPKESRATKLLNHLDTADQTTRAVLARELGAQGHDWIETKNALRSLCFEASIDSLRVLQCSNDDRSNVSANHAFSGFDVPGVGVWANLDVDKLLPVGGWRDPPLANLIVGLEPIWRRVTGRTAGPISLDKVGDAKRSPFSDWLGDMMEAINLKQETEQCEEARRRVQEWKKVPWGFVQFAEKVDILRNGGRAPDAIAKYLDVGLAEVTEAFDWLTTRGCARRQTSAGVSDKLNRPRVGRVLDIVRRKSRAKT
jgi:hypothetical protein